MALRIPTIEDVQKAETVIRQHISPVPLIRSYDLEKHLNLPPERRVWLKDYGWTPVGSFKMFGALNWMANNLTAIGERPVAAHSSGNFASGISYAGMRYKKKVIVVMPESAPQIKFERTRSFGADVRTYNIAEDQKTGIRDQLTRQIAEEENGLEASPYDDPEVIAGNGVGALEIVQELTRASRSLSHFFCPVSGGGLMAGQCLGISSGFPDAQIIGAEPSGAADFQQSLQTGQRVRLERPQSICDGLLSYDVGEHNWPLLKKHVTASLNLPDTATQQAMKWLYEHHGLRTEPSGAISVAALLASESNLQGTGDIVCVISGRNVDEDRFYDWIQSV
ncbi:MAG: threonine/serine dehydratase [Pirellulaceae bacterium]|nr:threonine/serine dehydratase [Pirellulaceae bacterium]